MYMYFMQQLSALKISDDYDETAKFYFATMLVPLIQLRWMCRFLYI